MTDIGPVAFRPHSSGVVFRGDKGETEALVLYNPKLKEETVLKEDVSWRIHPVFSPDGDYLIVADETRLAVWDMRSRKKEQSVFREGKFEIRGFVSNQQVVLKAEDCYYLFDVRKDKMVARTPESLVPVPVMGVTPYDHSECRKAVVRKETDQTDAPVIVWDLVTQRQVGTLPGKSAQFWTEGKLPMFSRPILSPEGRRAAFADQADGNLIRIWDTHAQQFVSRLLPEKHHGKALAEYRTLDWKNWGFSPNGSLFVGHGGLGKLAHLRIWNGDTGEQLFELPLVADWHWSRDGRFLVTRGKRYGESQGGSVGDRYRLGDIAHGWVSHTHIWQVSSPISQFSFPAAVSSLNFSPDGRRLLVNANTVLDVVRPHDRPLLRHSGLAAPAIWWCDELASTGVKEYHPLALTGKNDVWAAQPHFEHTFTYESLTIKQLAPEEREVVLDYPGLPEDPEKVRQYNQSSGSRSTVYGSRLVFHPDGNQFLLSVIRKNHWLPKGGMHNRGSPRSELHLFDLATQKHLRKVYAGLFEDFGFTDDGKYVYVRTPVHLQFFHIAEKKEVDKIPDRGEVVAFALKAARSHSPNGKLVATGKETGLIQLTDPQTKQLWAQWQAHEAKVTGVTFSPDGTILASGDRDGTVKLWPLNEMLNELKEMGLK